MRCRVLGFRSLFFSLSFISLIAANSIVTNVRAQDATPEFVSESVGSMMSAQAENSEQWDWLQLSSGEWLKGDVKVIYNGELEFDSDELGLLKFELEDVAVLQTQRILAALISGRETPVVGTVKMTAKEITVDSGGELHAFDRERLITLVSGTDRKNYWSIRLGLGTNIRSGNTSQTEYNGDLSVKRRTVFSRFSLDYLGSYSEARDVETTNNHRINSAFDIFAKQNLFYRPLFLELFSDKFQNLDARGTLGGGLGYHVIDTPDTSLDFFVGPGWQFTYFNQVEAGEDDRETSPVFLFTTDYETELTKSLDLDVTYQVLWANEASGGYSHHSIASFEYELTGSIDFDMAFVWDYTENPKTGEDMVQPESDDYRVLFSLSYEFN